MYNFLEKRSFRGILIFFFVFISIIPILILQYVSYNRLIKNLDENMNLLSNTNITQTKNNIEIALDAFHDILYQIYTNDEIIALIDDIESNRNAVAATSRLTRILRGMCYAKKGIEVCTIITRSGKAIYNDRITASSVRSSWLEKDGLYTKDILASMMSINETGVYPTSDVSDETSQGNYLFHMAHRFIDYRRIARNIGVAVLSLNEDILRDICGSDTGGGTFSAIVDKGGRLISYPDRERIGESLPMFDGDIKSAYKTVLEKDGYLTDRTAIYTTEAMYGWVIVTAVDQSALYDEISGEQQYMLTIGFVILTAAALLIFTISTLLSRSMDIVTAAMNRAQGGDLSVRITPGSVFSSEMATIVRTFNSMMQRIKELIDEVQNVYLRQKDAEIKALEAQINPHFMFNMLDNINWMAIDRDQWELSQMITSLARILRYSIDNSNAIVPLRDEIDWMRQYLFLLQTCGKKGFDYSFDVDGAALEYPVHKLIFQPFVENSIKHGFADSKRKNLLNVSAKVESGAVQIAIRDNGCGMDSDLAAGVLSAPDKGDDRIGMATAVGRIKMYYGDSADIKLETQIGIGTTITIVLNVWSV